MVRRYFWVGLIAIIVLFLSAVPFFEGYFFKKNYLALVEALNKENQPSVSIKILNYHLGWLTSSATVEMTIKPSSEFSFYPVIKQTITHGPLVYDEIHKQWRWALAAIQSDALFSSFVQPFFQVEASDPMIHAVSIAHFSGNYENVFNMGRAILSSATGYKILSQGAKGQLSMSFKQDKLQELIMNINLFPIASLSGDVLIDFRGMNFIFTQQRNIATEVTTTKNQLTVPMLSTTVLGDLYTLKNITLSTVTTEDKNKMSQNTLQMKVDSFSSPTLSLNKPTINILLQEKQPNASSVEMHFVSSLGELNLSGNINSNTQMTNVKTIEQFLKTVNAKVDARISDALLKKTMEWMPLPPPKNTLEAPTEANLLQLIDNLSNQNQIPLDIALQLKDLVRRHLPASVFATNISRFITTKDITPSVGAELINRYGILYPESTPSTKALVKPVELTGAVVSPAPLPMLDAQADRYDILLNDWVKQGYLMREDNDYLTTIEYREGAVLIGGLPVSL